MQPIMHAHYNNRIQRIINVRNYLTETCLFHTFSLFSNKLNVDCICFRTDKDVHLFYAAKMRICLPLSSIKGICPLAWRIS